MAGSIPTGPVFEIMNECVFVVGWRSMSFGIVYVTTGAVRGAELAPILHDQPGDELPDTLDRARR